MTVRVVHLFRREIHDSARSHGATVPRCHGATDEDIEHGLVYSVTWTELSDEPQRYLLARPDRAANLLELVVLEVGGDESVIHAIPIRHSTAQELFGDE